MSGSRPQVYVALMWLAAAGGAAVIAAHPGPVPPTSPVVGEPTGGGVKAPPPGGCPAAEHTPVIGPVRPVVRFRAHLGGAVTARPALSANGNLWVPSHAGVLHILGPDGTRKGSHVLGAPSYAGVAFAPTGLALVGTDAGRLFGLKLDGTRAFVVQAGGEIDGRPLVAPDGSIYFVAGPRLLSLNPSGQERFRHSSHGKRLADPVWHPSGFVLSGGQDHQLLALSTQGLRLFAYEAEADIDGAPWVDCHGTIYVGSDDGRVVALDATGRVRWSSRVGGFVRAPLSVSREGLLLGSVPGLRPALLALDPHTGNERFRFVFGLADSPAAGSRSRPLVDAAGNIYVGGHDDRLYSLTSEGRVRWTFQTGG